MTTPVRTIVTGVRDYLGNPDHKRLPNHTVLMRLWHKQSFYSRELKLTRENWMVNRFKMIVDPNTNEKAVNPPDGDFGEPYEVETFDEGNDNHVRREIPIVPYQDLDRLYQGTNTPQGGNGSQHVATGFAFYNLNGQWVAGWYPKHAVSADYRAWYTPEGLGPVTLEGNLRFPIDDMTNLITVDTAMACFDRIVDKEQTSLMAWQVEIKSNLQAGIQQYYPTFETLRHQLRRESVGRRGQWGSRRGRSGGGTEWI